MLAIPWSPSKSPIAPVGATARLYARVAFEREGVGVRAPAQILSLAFSEDGSNAFLSATDDTGVRLASLGRASAGLDASSLTREDRTALLGTLAGRRGTVDGVAFAPSQAKSSETVSLPLKRERLDTIELDEDAASGKDVIASDADPNGIIVVPIPQPPCEGSPVTMPICARWAPEGFRDIGVTSSVPSEDYSLNGPAAYANATVNDGLFPAWSGRLNGAGCSPPVTFCTNRVGMVVSTASLAVPTSSGVFTLYGTREFKITPTRSYVPLILFAYTPGIGTSGLAIVASSAYPVRVAAAVSRILTMPDNGVLRHKLNYTAPTLNLHTENGCVYESDFQYTPGRYGEACATIDGNEAWFGPSLGMINGTYVLTGRHTTEDAYTIGHELGHSAQRASNGGPQNAGYGGPSTGYCSCYHVNDGNQIHCLQSRHLHASAETEGFGHFYAARVMNDQGATCRFTYYKNFLRRTEQDPNFWGNYAPPVPVDCGVPYTYSANGVTTHGWVPSICPAPNTSSEYDWLTFLWAVNGSATTAQRSSMTDLFTILGGAGQGENFTWASVRAKAESHFGANFTKRNRFTDSGQLHGVNQ